MSSNFPSTKPRILVAPLDWGLGHATRCIPIINALLTNNCDVLLAGEGKAMALLQQEFPQLTAIPLKGYNIHYGKTKWEVYGKLLLQIPKILEAINKENEWLEEAIDTYDLDAVISDNRYGLYTDRIPSVFITHQLLIKTSLGDKADRFLQKFNYHFVDDYSQCWVPDVDDPTINLAGELAHPAVKPKVPVSYIGPLSRFQYTGESFTEKHLLFLLSGPEPQRTLLEQSLLAQVGSITAPVLLVRGLPGETAIDLEVPPHVSVVNHLDASALEQAVKEAVYIIARCGYSTVMDLMALQKKSILIPTPGQTEQEYLAGHLISQGMALCMEQEQFDLAAALGLAQEFNYYFPEPTDDTTLQTAVASFVQQIVLKKEKLEEKSL
jgi:uncharacterized protein (TIGR00661 family)